MVDGFHRVRQIFFEKAPKDFGVKIRDRTDDEKDLHPHDGDQRVERIRNRQRVNEGEDEEDADEAFEILPAFVGAAGETVEEGDARREADERNGHDARKGDDGQIISECPIIGNGHHQHVDKDQQQGGGGGAAMRHVHSVEAAEIFFRPPRPRGDEQRASQQNDIVRADDFARVLADEVLASVVFRREDEPNDNVQENEGEDNQVAEIGFAHDGLLTVS